MYHIRFLPTLTSRASWLPWSLMRNNRAKDLKFTGGVEGRKGTLVAYGGATFAPGVVDCVLCVCVCVCVCFKSRAETQKWAAKTTAAKTGLVSGG